MVIPVSNFSYMRISDAYLMLAEYCAALGNGGLTPRRILPWVAHQTYPGNDDPKGFFEKYIWDCGSVYNAVLKVDYENQWRRHWFLLLSQPVFFRKLHLN